MVKTQNTMKTRSWTTRIHDKGKQMSKWIELKSELFKNHPTCKLCNERPAVHLHHAVINKGKIRSKKLHKYLDHRFNALEVCEVCHPFADAYDIRKTAWEINCERYGKSNMETWYFGLPFKVKEMFE